MRTSPPLDAKFELELLDLLFEVDDAGVLRVTFLAKAVDFQPLLILNLVARIRGKNQSPQRSATQMRTVLHARAAVLMIWIKAKFHRHPSLNAATVADNPTSR